MNPLLHLRETAVALQAHPALRQDPSFRNPDADALWDALDAARQPAPEPEQLTLDLAPVLPARPFGVPGRVCSLCGFEGEWGGYPGFQCPKCPSKGAA